MSELGVVWESKGDMFKFGLFKGKYVDVGEIVKVVSGDRLFYARVTNTESGFTVNLEEILKRMTGLEDYGPFSKYRSVDAVVMLQLENGTLRTPTFNPTCEDRVYPTTDEDHKLLGLKGDLHIGYLRSGSQQTKVPVGIQTSALPRHIGLFGVTGSGKTNAEAMINARILEKPDVAGLIFDFHGELLEGKGIGKGLADHPLFALRGRYYGREKIKIGRRTLRASDILEIFTLTEPQRIACREFERELGEEWVQKALESNVFQENLRAHKSSIEAVLRRLDDLSADVFPDSTYSVAHKIVEDVKSGMVVLIDLSGLDFEDQKRVTRIIGRRVALEYKRLFREDYERWRRLPTLLITLEEAHNFLYKPKDRDETKPFFSEIALTYRKYRVGLCAVTPRPSNIDPDVFAEIWTKIVMKTTFKRDRVYIIENTPYLEYSDFEIKVLDRGEALLVSEPQLRFAVPIKTIHYPEYLETMEKVDYKLPESEPLDRMDEQIKKLKASHFDLFK